MARIAAQPMALEEKARRATYVVDNSGSQEDLASKIRGITPAVQRRSLIHILASGPTCLVILFVGVVVAIAGALVQPR